MFCEPGFTFFNMNFGRDDANYLEIGVFNGDSIAKLARAYPHKTVFGIDPFIEDGCTMHTSNVKENEYMPTQHENTLKNIEGLPNVTLFEMTSVAFNEILTDELIEDMNIGWVLIDGSHHYEDVINDVHMAMRLIGKKTGAIVFDDLNLPDVAKAHAEFKEIYKNNISQEVDIYPHHPGHIITYIVNYVKP